MTDDQVSWRDRHDWRVDDGRGLVRRVRGSGLLLHKKRVQLLRRNRNPEPAMVGDLTGTVKVFLPSTSVTQISLGIYKTLPRVEYKGFFDLLIPVMWSVI